VQHGAGPPSRRAGAHESTRRSLWASPATRPATTLSDRRAMHEALAKESLSPSGLRVLDGSEPLATFGGALASLAPKRSRRDIWKSALAQAVREHRVQAE